MTTPANGSKYKPQANLGVLQIMLGDLPAFIQFCSDYFMMRKSRSSHYISKRAVRDASYVCGFTEHKFQLYWNILLQCKFILGCEEDGYELTSKENLLEAADNFKLFNCEDDNNTASNRHLKKLNNIHTLHLPPDSPPNSSNSSKSPGTPPRSPGGSQGVVAFREKEVNPDVLTEWPETILAHTEEDQS
jgi:hypothetical protein